MLQPSQRVKDEAKSGIALIVYVWPRGVNGPRREWTLRCGQPDGTLPAPGRACKRLAALKEPFAPVPMQVACTEIYGGPQVAEVRGTFRSHMVRARFTRTNGCEIARWNRVRFLFPAGG